MPLPRFGVKGCAEVAPGASRSDAWPTLFQRNLPGSGTFGVVVEDRGVFAEKRVERWGPRQFETLLAGLMGIEHFGLLPPSLNVNVTEAISPGGHPPRLTRVCDERGQFRQQGDVGTHVDSLLGGVR